MPRVLKPFLDLSSPDVLVGLNLQHCPHLASLLGAYLPILAAHWPVVSVVDGYLFVESQGSTLHKDDLLHLLPLLSYHLILLAILELQVAAKDVQLVLTPKPTGVKLLEELTVL